MHQNLIQPSNQSLPLGNMMSSWRPLRELTMIFCSRLPSAGPGICPWHQADLQLKWIMYVAQVPWYLDNNRIKIKCLNNVLWDILWLILCTLQVSTFKRPPKPLPRTRPPRKEKPPTPEKPPKPERPPPPAEPVWNEHSLAQHFYFSACIFFPTITAVLLIHLLFPLDCV